MGGKIYIGNSGESITVGTLKVGTAITASGGIITATGVQITGISTLGITTLTDVTAQQLNVSGITTAAEFVGGGSDLRNLSGTHLVSYASASDISNSALSISGISTYNEVGILTGSNTAGLNENFGTSVATSADGKTIVVGAAQDETSGTDTGVVYVYDREGNNLSLIHI